MYGYTIHHFEWYMIGEVGLVLSVFGLTVTWEHFQAISIFGCIIFVHTDMEETCMHVHLDTRKTINYDNRNFI